MDHDYPLVEYIVLVPNDGLTSPGFPCNSSTKHPGIIIQSRSATSTYPKMKLLAVHLSGHPSDIQTFHQILQMLSWSRGDQPQGQDMTLYPEDGKFCDIKK